MGEPLTRIILDTDLAMGAPGSDIDGGFALAGHRRSLPLPSTRHHESAATATSSLDRLTREVLAVLRRSDVPVVQGARPPVSTLPRRTCAGRTAGRAPSRSSRSDRSPNVARAFALDPEVARDARDMRDMRDVVIGGLFLEPTNVAGCLRSSRTSLGVLLRARRTRNAPDHGQVHKALAVLRPAYRTSAWERTSFPGHQNADSCQRPRVHGALSGQTGGSTPNISQLPKARGGHWQARARHGCPLAHA